MIGSQLSTIAAAILAKNTYFDNGYADVYFDETEGYVYRDPVNGSASPVFPNDTLGDYFYLRLPQQWGFSTDTTGMIADGISLATVSAPVVLVAYMKGADADKLALNLITTLRALGCGLNGGTIALQSATAQSDVVLLQELRGLDDAGQESALARLGEGITLVSVTFTLSMPLPYNTCIEDPCKC